MDERKLHLEVQRALADRLLADRGVPALAHLVVLALVAPLVWSLVPRAAFLTWAGAIVSLTVARIVVWRRMRIRRPSPASVAIVARSTVAGLGLAWGVGTAVAAPDLPFTTVAVIVTGLAGLLAGAVSTLVADRWVFKLYLLAMSGPVVIAFLLAPRERPTVTELVLIVAFAAFMWREHGRAHDTLVDHLRTERLLRDSETRFRLLSDSNIIGIGFWNASGAITDANDEYLRTIGYTREDLAAGVINFRFLTPPEYAEMDEHVLQRLAAGERVAPWEKELIRKDGGRVSVVVGVTPLKERPDRGVVFTLDVMDRKRAEEALAQSEAHHRALIEQALDIVTLLDAEAVMQYLSPSVERVLGYTPTELVGKRAFDFLHPDDLEPTLRAFMDGVATPGLTRTVEYRFRHKDGSWRYLEGVGRNLLEDSLIKAIVVNARDVSDRKAAEESQRTLLRELQTALAEVKTLRGYLRICASCKRVNTDDGKWEQFESYVRGHTEVEFSHGICPDCAAKWADEMP